ncbi:MAG: DUF4349 domain-containing protein [Flavobacteriales bacterium]
MKRIINYFKLIILLMIIGCANSNDVKMKILDEVATESIEQQKTEDITERKLIKEGHVEFETNDLSLTRKTVFKAVNQYKGYVSSDQEFKSSGYKRNVIIIRVPADDFDNLLKESTQGVERFENKEINIKDVTEEFLDVQARLKTKKELENRYIDLLKQAKNVTEILEIETQIGQLRSEIESIEGRLKYLQNRVSFSTLTLTFYESIPNQIELGGKFKNSFIEGWDNLISFFVVLTSIWPFVIILLGVIIGIKIYRKRKYKHRN